MWIIYVFMAIFIPYAIYSNHKEKKAMKPGGEPVEKPPEESEATLMARAWAWDRMEKMEKQGLGEYIARDYYFKNEITQRDLRSLKAIEKKLNLILVEMEQYLKLPQTYHVHVVNNSHNQASVNSSGNCDYEHYTINVFYKAFQPNTLKTIISHECAHYFTYYNGLSVSDEYMNERYTDTVAMLMGFGKYLLATKGNPGYLHYDQLREVRWAQLKKRKEMAEKPQTTVNQEKPQRTVQQPGRKPVQRQILETSRGPIQKPPGNPVGKATNRTVTDRTVTEKNTVALGTEREELRKSILAARELIAQTKDLVRANKVPTSTDLYPHDYDFLKKAVEQLNAGRYEDILNNAEGRMSGNLRDIEEACGMTMTVCQELNRVMRAFA